MAKKIINTLLEQKKSKLKGNLYHNTQIMFSFNTNRIEGSKLTEEETRLIFEENTTPDCTTNVDDIIETTNHFILFDCMLDHYNEALTEKLIKTFHMLLKRSTSDERREWFNVGEYKRLSNEVGGSDTTEPNNVSKEINELLDWYNNLKRVTIEDIIEFHYKFEIIHPFQDGNGRVGRIILFKECLKNDIIPFIIDEEHKLFYYRGLREYKNDKQYLIDTCLSCQDEYINLVNKFLGE
jgi:Fic family protein